MIGILLIISCIIKGNGDDFDDSDVSDDEDDDDHYRGFYKCNLERDMLRLSESESSSAACSSDDGGAISPPPSPLVAPSNQPSDTNLLQVPAGTSQSASTPSPTPSGDETLVKSDSCRSLSDQQLRHSSSSVMNDLAATPTIKPAAIDDDEITVQEDAAKSNKTSSRKKRNKRIKQHSRQLEFSKSKTTKEVTNTNSSPIQSSDTQSDCLTDSNKLNSISDENNLQSKRIKIITKNKGYP